MKLGGCLQAAVSILKNIDKNKCFAFESLRDWEISHRYAGASDRENISNIVFDVLRQRLSISWRMDSDEIFDISYGALLLNNESNFSNIEVQMLSEKFPPKPLSTLRKKSWYSKNLKDAPYHIQANIPKWYISSLEKSVGRNWFNEGISLSKRASIDLCINSIKATPKKILKKIGVYKEIGIVPWYRNAIRLNPPIVGFFERYPNFYKNLAFQQGWFEVQDLGSQVASYLCQSNPKMQVLDYCAGRGGKTINLSIHMKNMGKIYAYDINKRRLSEIFFRLRRCGINNVKICSNKQQLKSLYNKMDLVVLDVPCSGTGTWRRNPDLKWNLTDFRLKELIKEQKKILEDAITFVKVGGKIVYITCSLLFEENDVQIRNFLISNNKKFQSVNMYEIWSKMIWKTNKNFSNIQRKKLFLHSTPYFSKYGVILSPFLNQTDGFFIAVLKRII